MPEAVTGKLYDVLSQVFNKVAGVSKIIVPGEFKSFQGNKYCHANVKAESGLLYPLKSSLVFIHKPVIYITLREISKVVVRSNFKTMDFVVHRSQDKIEFLGIDKEEKLQQYFELQGVKVVNEEKEKVLVQQESGDEEEAEDESFEEE
jgi:structure-specific recognition protein 1